MFKIQWKKYILHFKTPAGTSRGIITSKGTYYLKVWDDKKPDIIGLGECNLFHGFSFDDKPEYESILDKLVENPSYYLQNLHDVLLHWPSIRCGLEMALKDL